MIDWASWTDVGVAGIALVISGGAFYAASRKSDADATDKRIDERCRLMFGETLAVLKNDVETIKKAVQLLVNRDL